MKAKLVLLVLFLIPTTLHAQCKRSRCNNTLQKKLLLQQMQQQQAVIYLNNMLVIQTTREMMSATDHVLKQGLEHPWPLYRYSAALAVGKRKKVNFKDQLVDLLADPNIIVQQTARQSLKTIYGKDFGPLPGTTFDQITETIDLWKTVNINQQLK